MNNYTPVGDLIVSSVCLVMIVLLFFSYNRHTRSFRIFLALIGLLILAANTNVSFYMLVTTGDPRIYPLAYFLRWLYHGILFTILFFYVAYIIDVTRMEGREKRIAFSAAGGLWLIVVATDAVDYKDRIRDAIDGFYDEYAKFRFDYKIAIELTESQTEDDFILMKVKIDQLKERGIKFDRSLLLASDSNERSRTIVSSLANMFARMKYSVLYEGVEREDEERMCIDMDASFLQGYKYSRPVPIEELDHFFEKAEWSLIL